VSRDIGTCDEEGADDEIARTRLVRCVRITGKDRVRAGEGEGMAGIAGPGRM
jgi:hypothetical protein